MVCALAASAQQAEKKPTPPIDSAQGKPTKQDDKQPQIKLNMLHVCTPGEEEKQLLGMALAKVPHSVAFVQDFELTRGVTTTNDAKLARYLRLRRELPEEAFFSSALYSLSTDPDATSETLVLKTRDAKDFVSISMDDSVSAGAAPASSLLDVDTPPSRIRLERAGKSSVVLARCDSGGQDAYEPLFKQAADLMSQWRKSLGLRGAFQSDIAWLTGSTKSPSTKKNIAKPPSFSVPKSSDNKSTTPK